MAKVVVVGAGWAGCAAALAACKAGAEVELLERTDMLLGTGLVGGIMRNNGRYTATEEAIAMGGGELFHLCDQFALHKSIDFPGHKHASLYDVYKLPYVVEQLLQEKGVKISFQKRVVEADFTKGYIQNIKTQSQEIIEGDAFIDCTGTAGGLQNCARYGNGCAMCVMRCPTFGGRVSLTKLAGIQEYVGYVEENSVGSMSGSCIISKNSLEPELINRLERDGVMVIPIPEELRIKNILKKKTCQQYASKEYEENLILLDTGDIKLMMPYFPLEYLHCIKGFERARYEDPYSGGIGNSMRFLAVAPRHNSLLVEGTKNLFCAGEKSGFIVGHTEAIVTGLLAGYNSARYLASKELLEIPTTLLIGDFIAFTREDTKMSGEKLKCKYTFSGSIYFSRMCEIGLYTLNLSEIENRVKDAGLKDIFSHRVL